jgi:hypothetical protein
VTGGADHSVTVVTVPGCHLCADAVSTVAGVCAETGAGWAERDLFGMADDDVRRWRDLVPVVLVDGEVVETLRVDARRLRAALTAVPRSR